MTRKGAQLWLKVASLGDQYREPQTKHYKRRRLVHSDCERSFELQCQPGNGIMKLLACYKLLFSEDA